MSSSAYRMTWFLSYFGVFGLPFYVTNYEQRKAKTTLHEPVNNFRLQNYKFVVIFTYVVFPHRQEHGILTNDGGDRGCEDIQ